MHAHLHDAITSSDVQSFFGPARYQWPTAQRSSYGRGLDRKCHRHVGRLRQMRIARRLEYISPWSIRAKGIN